MTHATGPSGQPDDATIEAVGKLSEALETVERARGHLYSFHQLIGGADFAVEDAADLLARAGHRQLAEELRRQIMGRNVLPGRWTFQVVEEFDDTYYEPFRAFERRVRDELTGGRRHLHEARMKEERRTHGLPGHEATPEG
ncbi:MULTISPECIES: hypothetical protein [Thermomonospora]|uniref:Uncharacterized protein n=1 Tax=Thermomonospora curvata (strain ATCC 19995 / DSM 43183 / JCM 3096 / KCTC 9072 / NBRC 15933 / NCIMB 10081 / Henssen B9) TaxID=471852 RepID=D1A2H0_THECD|nr:MULTISPECIES: hypothetical protein [Thermomonospora]ACY95990.1 hypothetical protein Tcur_0389 [Thermomonospora curvata DSM 43183]PKK16022.1 MAG: hypothetical protein BUE48_001905 [Thermomonospora sp. CIF 1]